MVYSGTVLWADASYATARTIDLLRELEIPYRPVFAHDGSCAPCLDLGPESHSGLEGIERRLGVCHVGSREIYTKPDLLRAITPQNLI